MQNDLAALSAGWSVDQDWWWRPMRDGDQHFVEPGFGFTTRGHGSCVFVANPARALAYDRSLLINNKRFEV
ncbi:hypothetical protein [Bradyrhizobium sp. SZCCHNR3118]|uniref:hypothetical protein n=1 Tax=Bradyrhizobium sp. SZCCHNR3118 TaxID=3057468 RepID=UPI0029161B86|nr:hypothetical protein [Bradyrhizobium sp. SZCCHNR3118]